MPHRLTPAEALGAAQTAVVTDRTRVSDDAEDQMAESSWTAADVECAIRSATMAEAIHPPECWRLSGGRTIDGEPMAVEIEVRESVVRILGLARA